MVAYTRGDFLELTNGELCVLRWLRISDGKATLSAKAVAGNSLFVVPDRLLKAGYVKTHADPPIPRTVYAHFIDLAKRRRSRARGRSQ
jgi:hypothetical protein